MVRDCSQDFFIYVPPTNEVEAFSFVNGAEEDKRDSMQVHEGATGSWKLALTEWVRIPLEGQVVVYARWHNHRWPGEIT